MKCNGITVVKSSDLSLYLPFNKMGKINYPLRVFMRIKFKNSCKVLTNSGLLFSKLKIPSL